MERITSSLSSPPPVVPPGIRVRGDEIGWRRDRQACVDMRMRGVRKQEGHLYLCARCVNSRYLACRGVEAGGVEGLAWGAEDPFSGVSRRGGGGGVEREEADDWWNLERRGKDGNPPPFGETPSVLQNVRSVRHGTPFLPP